LSCHYGRTSTLRTSYASLAYRSLSSSWPPRYKSPWLATRTPCNIQLLTPPPTDITPTSGFSTEVVQLSLITVNRCDLDTVATLRFRRTMSSTLRVWGSRRSSPMEDVEKRCCPATTGAPLHYRPAMHRSRTARSPLRGLLATNPRGWRLEHHVIYSCSHPRRPILHRPQVFRPKLLHYRY